MRMREKLDFVILAVANATAWLSNMEQVLKLVLLLVSIGFALHRWIYWSRTKKTLKEDVEP